MSKKALFFVFLLIIVMGIFGWIRTQHEASSREGKSVSLTCFDLAKVKIISIHGNDKSVEFKEETPLRWIASSAYGYEADLSKINQFLLKVRELKSSQRVTSNKERYEQLGLGQKKITLSLKDSAGTVLFAMDFGKTREASSERYYGDTGRYVRVLPGEDVYLLGENIPIETDSQNWLKKEILSLERKNLSEIHLLKTEPLLTIVNTSKDGEKFELKGWDSAKEKENTSAVEQVLGVFSSLSFANVFEPGDAKLSQLKFIPLITILTKDGLSYQFDGVDDKGQFFLKISVSVNKDPEIKPAEDTQTRAQTLNQNFSKWIYQLESWDALKFSKKHADMVEKLPGKEEAAPQTPQPPAEPAEPSANDANENPADEPPVQADAMKTINPGPEVTTPESAEEKAGYPSPSEESPDKTQSLTAPAEIST
ncbi:MAG: DUF4340 domain-containing protein [Candidatus Aureabacteria bacterium]|nr:DUF4340 domain-containing protein [Candidatus Auribacterota bacterium]